MKNIRLSSRHIHLDFHTSPHIPNVGKNFCAEKFVNTLKKAKVSSINIFARCHHGMLYYDSKLFPERVHPNLAEKDLMKKMAEACQKHNIKVSAYLTVQWDKFTAEEHPEWLCQDENGRRHGYPTYKPGFYENICMNSKYRDMLKAMIKEVFETTKIDGFWLDIVMYNDCSCVNCRKDMVRKGYEPHIQEDRQAFSKWMIDDFKRDISDYIANLDENLSVFYNASHIGYQTKSGLDAYSHLELESIPSGDWGYITFPVSMRYARTLGKDCVAHTGKFHIEWGDLHSFKNPHALEYECFKMLALGSKCLVGDQLDPAGELNEYAYDMIGDVFDKIEKLDPWCDDLSYRCDFAVLNAEEFVGGRRGNLPVANMGAEYMFSALAYQYDFIDTDAKFEKYKLIIMPDNITVDEKLHKKLQEYIACGGKIIATFESGMDKECENMVFAETCAKAVSPTLNLDGKIARGVISPNNEYVDYIVPKGAIGKNLPETEHVMYAKGLEVENQGGEVLLNFTKPYFDRTYKHFCSHRQTPSSGEYGNPAVIKNGNVIYIASPVFTIYNARAAKWCRTLVQNAIEMLIGKQIITHSGPSTMTVTVNTQEKENRDVVHLLHYIPEQRCSEILTVDDIIPVYNVDIELCCDKTPKSVRLVPDNKEIDFEFVDGIVKFTVGKVNGYAVYEVQYY